MKVILHEDDDAYQLLMADIKEMVKIALVEVRAGVIPDIPEEEEVKEWCNSKEAMRILDCKTTKLQEIRDNSPFNGVVIKKPSPRKIKYNIDSLYKYLGIPRP